MVDESALTLLKRDEARTSLVEVKATDAWHYDDGDAFYLLECEQQLSVLRKNKRQAINQKTDEYKTHPIYLPRYPAAPRCD
jgi:hypothetical protein